MVFILEENHSISHVNARQP